MREFPYVMTSFGNQTLKVLKNTFSISMTPRFTSGVLLYPCIICHSYTTTPLMAKDKLDYKKSKLRTDKVGFRLIGLICTFSCISPSLNNLL